jgi:hypothetical protein
MKNASVSGDGSRDLAIQTRSGLLFVGSQAGLCCFNVDLRQ